MQRIPTQQQHHILSYTLVLFWIALLPVVPLSLSALLAAIFGIKWLMVLSEQSSDWLIKFACVSLSLVLMQISGLLGFSVNGFIHLAALGVFLRFIEVENKKDITSLLYLLIFIGVTPLLLNQEILQTCLVLLVFLFTLNNLVIAGQHTRQNNSSSFLRTLRFSTLQLLICLPIMLILFLTFPRLPPLWAMPDPENSAKTGLSDSMSPGSIAQLAESNERAFRVSFLDANSEVITDASAQPTMEELYWRVLTMDRYDGATWYQSTVQNEQLQPITTDYGDIRHYRLYMDKTAAGWLAILNRPVNNLAIGQWRSDGTARLQKSELASKQSRFIYQGETSYRAYQANTIDSIERQQLLQLPDNINPRTRKLAKSLRFASSGVAVSDTQFINSVLNYFAEGFIYTWEPPLLTEPSQVDQFLFESRQGFCGHYASALAVMARMQGIPARIVNGYLGGAFNPHAGFWEVQQKEAHAWVELYYDNKWHRVDPTAVVSDIRVSEGMDRLIAPSRSFVENALNLPLLIGLQQRLQAIGHFWDQNIAGYDGATRISLMNRINEVWQRWRPGFYWILSIITVGIILLKPQWLVWLLSRCYRPPPVHQRLMNRFDQLLFHRLNQNCLNSHSLTLNDIQNLSISERKQLVQRESSAYRQQSLRFLTEYQQWRFNPKINGTTNGAGRRAVIRLKRILQGLSKIRAC